MKQFVIYLNVFVCFGHEKNKYLLHGRQKHGRYYREKCIGTYLTTWFRLQHGSATWTRTIVIYIEGAVYCLSLLKVRLQPSFQTMGVIINIIFASKDVRGIVNSKERQEGGEW